MSSPYADLDRPPLSAGRLRRDLAGTRWTDLRVVAETGSTNADVLAAAAGGAAEGLVVLAEHQHGGRGRQGRTWSAPARSGLLVSVLLRPPHPLARWGLLPLVAGLALADAVTDRTGLDVRLKWPNDLLAADGRKLAGILAEAAGPALALGVGLNVTLRADELPDPRAGSLRLAGAEVTDREPLAKELLRALDRRYTAWCATPALPADYRARCETIGRRVRLELPGGGAVHGTADGVDDDGALLLAEDGGGPARRWPAGDVVHLRAEG